jgi:DNA polymerase III epsilon subunit-like protein
MARKGWRYKGRGECPECDDGNCDLTVPSDNYPHFKPVCFRCSGKYNLDDICRRHRLPTRDGVCQLCVSRR